MDIRKDGYVFISYSSTKRDYADATRDLLLKKNISCWMAPYDIPSGKKYAGVINDAVKKCKCLLLLLNKEAQDSEFVNREVDRAVANKKRIITIQLEDMEFNSDFEFYLSNGHIERVNKIDENLPEIDKIIDSIRELVQPKNQITQENDNPLLSTSQKTNTKGLIETELEKANKLFNSKAPLHYNKCFEILETISNSNFDEFIKNIESVMNLAYCYEKGKGTYIDSEKAFKWYTIAANNQNAEAFRKLGEFYYYGKEKEKNYSKAYKIFMQASKHGDILSNLYLGNCYDYGMGVEQDYAEALKYYQKTVHIEDVKELLRGAGGFFIANDKDKVVNSISRDIEEAQIRVGDFYFRGLGVKKDYKEAVKWYLKASKLDNNNITHNSDAILRLSLCYRKGLGVKKNIHKARWYTIRALLIDGITINFGVRL